MQAAKAAAPKPTFFMFFLYSPSFLLGSGENDSFILFSIAKVNAARGSGGVEYLFQAITDFFR